MKVIIADKAGFCFGVKRAVDMAIQASESVDQITSYGQLIHNDQVSERLREKGIYEAETIESISSGHVIIRSHGVSKAVYQQAQSKNLTVIDCTCPYVKKVHDIVKKHTEMGYKIIIVGDENHPEVQGILGWCHEGRVIHSVEEAQALGNDPYCVVAQTTLNQKLWEDISGVLGDQDQIILFNTICLATKERQDAALELAKKVDCMIVIGGYHSSNTKKLYEICKATCKKTYHIEKKSDLVMTNLENCGIIGITAGASTPDWIINEIFDHLVQLN